jgi:two-component system nitrogen regulation response regulator GlnG
MSQILIVDDEPAIGWSLGELLDDRGHCVKVSSSVEEALETCRHFAPDLLLLDVRLPGRDGLSAIPDFRALVPSAAVVVMTAFGDLDTAVRAVEAGAAEYLVKPFDSAQVTAIVDRLLERGVIAPRSESPAPASGLVGRSAAMQRVFARVALAASSELPVLITGATGTGKELAAHAIHAHSARRSGALVPVNLAALPPSLVEGELFGQAKGAFSGATARDGAFARADGGTIFLDEVGDAAPEVQARLLRVLEAREILPLGATAPHPVDVRVIAATNRDLAADVAGGRFRADLLHRLRVFTIEMPTLAERLDDVPALVSHFLAGSPGCGPLQSASEAFLDAVVARPWPGNVRELKAAVDVAAVLARGGTLGPEHLPPPLSGAPGGTTIGRSAAPAGEGLATADARLQQAVRAWVGAQIGAGTPREGWLHEDFLNAAEAALIGEVLARTEGNRTAAARILGLDRATLRGKLPRD